MWDMDQQLEAFSSLMKPVPSNFGSIYGPIHIELRENIFDEERVIEIKFPFKHVVKGLFVETKISQSMKSFEVYYKRNDMVRPHELTPIDFNNENIVN